MSFSKRLVPTGVRMKSAMVVLALPAIALCTAAVGAQTAVRPLVNTRDSAATISGTDLGDGIPANRIRLSVDGQISDVAISNLSQLLSGRFAGVQVLTPGATGMASRIRVRGQSSLVLNNDPLIIVDGVRLIESVHADNRAVLSRVDDINVNEIATIDLFSGPAGTALYGSGAANGVISITTKRGAAGKTRVNAYGEGGVITDPNDYPEQWALWGKRGTNPVSGLCTLSLVAAGSCTVDSLTHGSVLKNSAATPIDLGYRTRYGAQVSGGAAKFQYFVAAEREDETGVFKMPALEVQRLKTERGVSSIPENQQRPSARVHNTARVNLSAQPFAWLSFDVSSGYVNGDARFVTSENTADGIWANVLGSPWTPDAKDVAGVPLRGYWRYPAGDIMSQTNTQSIDRYINTVSAKVQPRPWLSARASFAKDDATQHDLSLVLTNEGPQSNFDRSGYLSESDFVTSNTTLTASATASFAPVGWFGTTTTVGAQGIKTDFYENARLVFGLMPGSTVPAGNGQSERYLTSKSRSNAYYLSEAITFGDRFFVSAGVRNETPKAYAGKPYVVNNYHVGTSWLLSRQQFLKNVTWLNTLRLRSAYGTSGQYPSILSGYAPLVFDQSGAGGGNALFPFTAAPEISAELEGGVDVSLRDNTSQLSVTYYNKRTRDALVGSFQVPGIGVSARLVQGAVIQNRGLEITARQQLAAGAAFSADIGVTASRNRNRVLEFPAGVPPVFNGNRNTLKSLKGYPLFGVWGRNYTYRDANNDGIIVPGELTFSDTSVYLGSSFPTNELALTPSVQLFNRTLRFSAQIDSKWGYKKFNNTLRHQCQSALSCRGIADKTAPLDEQAAAVAVNDNFVLSGFIEDGSFTRFREASVAYTLPVRWARAVRASEWNVVLTGRNLGVATKYSGIDPEAAEGSTDTSADEFFATPAMRYWTLRVNFRF